MFNINLGKTFGKWMQAAADLLSGKHFSKNEGRLAADAYAVKSKLGQSFFTRKLSPATREAKIRRLSLAEKVVASQQGWLGLTPSEMRAAVRKGLIELA